MTASRYKLFGVYVSQPVFDALAAHLHEEAGVVDLESYFDPATDSVPQGDPGADATADLVMEVVGGFTSLYDDAPFETVSDVDPNSFVLTHLAAPPKTVANARERFEAAATIQETDHREVHTAILAAYFDVGP
ncbi:uncharacterized protein Nmag_0348 [Natrialba magadii ATCC 43099]|uniref:Uncharacterized protein n=1 Tax=Natrialba magadii (strain ATCC 43099 / DSM 3394 / CCM 3739 / CIP 104546 / IAM 13178 / JCM 8861 / NBRC 102185 / NCIMB 2190 / MS3) TaxID=547559 RepID=D3SXB8_NATMM|nr:hypothetical protein [Natrialba magadii]ADD03938.1 uncharacterized protein Nmag_0348 [Natrialba magadii ATCC 43099]ELY33601.1 hypothetical protein C500_02175 [Natrialba magadii ATCC 43099]